MKSVAIALLAVFFLMPDSFGQGNDIAGLLNNEKSRNEIFNTILNGHELMMDFIAAMKENEHAMMMLKANTSVTDNTSGSGMPMGSNQHMSGMMGENQNMSGMMGEDQNMMNQMMGIMKENPELVPQMMSNMMDLCDQDSTQCGQMAAVMSQHPHLMNMGIQKMNENGSVAETQHMNMMNPTESDNGSMHHMHH